MIFEHQREALEHDKALHAICNESFFIQMRNKSGMYLECIREMGHDATGHKDFDGTIWYRAV